jgi:hypothetical protein
MADDTFPAQQGPDSSGALVAPRFVRESLSFHWWSFRERFEFTLHVNGSMVLRIGRRLTCKATEFRNFKAGGLARIVP